MKGSTVGYLERARYTRHRATSDTGFLSIQPPDWMLDGLCAQVDTDIFFPEKGGTTAPGKQVCRLCPVTAECLDFALANNERFGIWGGKVGTRTPPAHPTGRR